MASWRSSVGGRLSALYFASGLSRPSRSCWNDRPTARRVSEGQAGSAYPAEDVGEAFGLRGLVAAQSLFTPGIGEGIERNEGVRGKSSSSDLATAAAMAMMGPAGFLGELVLDRTAKTTSLDYYVFHSDRVPSILQGVARASRPLKLVLVLVDRLAAD